MKTLILVGDRNETILAHGAVEKSLELAGIGAGWRWIRSGDVTETVLGEAAGLWLVPGSPYESLEGALETCRWAREHGTPFLGTCGGFQHAILEIAQNVCGLRTVTHAEIDPASTECVIAPLACGLVEARGAVQFLPGSRLRGWVESDRTEEGYHCRFGVNPAYRKPLEKAGFQFSARDDAEEIRGGEWVGHPFYAGTLFQPERWALQGRLHPLVKAWIRAALSAGAA